MLCQYCKSEAKFICRCLIILCRDHTDAHSKTCKQSYMKIIENSDKLKLQSKELAKRINKIDKTINETIKKTKETLSKIENFCSENVNRLKIQREKVTLF